MAYKIKNGFKDFDNRVFFLIQGGIKSKIIGKILKHITRMFDPPSYVAMVSVFFLVGAYFDFRLKKALALFCISQIITFVLKRIFVRTRPYKKLDGAVLVLKEPKDPHSFPSGHTGSAFMLAIMVSVWSVPLSIPFFFLAVLCGISRIYLGMHYPSDVLAGAILSAVIYVLVSMFFNY